HAGLDGEVVHALLRLFDQGVAKDLPVQVLGAAAYLLQRLVDRHRADRHRRVADDPLAREVDVPAGGQVHHRVRAPADRPHQLLDLLGHARGHRAVADVGVDLGQEVAADDHRLALRVFDVARQDRAPAGDLVAHELGRDNAGYGRTKGFAAVRRHGRAWRGFAALVLADRRELHLRGDDAPARIVHLGDVGPGAGRALADPAGAQRWQAAGEVDRRAGVGVGAGRVVERERRVVAATEH